jgi:hypothetical protein
MKLIATALTVLTVASYANAYTFVPTPDGLKSLYTTLGFATTIQLSSKDGTTEVYNDNSPFQFVTGFALGTQVDPLTTESTCYGQAIQTKGFLD